MNKITCIHHVTSVAITSTATDGLVFCMNSVDASITYATISLSLPLYPSPLFVHSLDATQRQVSTFLFYRA